MKALPEHLNAPAGGVLLPQPAPRAVSPDPTRADPAPDWPERLRQDLLPVAQTAHDLVCLLQVQFQIGPATLRADADRLARASTDLLTSARRLAELDGAARRDGVRATRHDLLNLVNHVSGYSQLLLEEDDALTGDSRADLQRVAGLSQDCTQIILRHLARERPDEAPAPAAPAPAEAAGIILVVDDDDDNRLRLVRALKALGHTLHEARDGQEAIDRIRQGSFDLVLLDIAMPRVDGYGVLRWIRSDPRRQRLPVLMVSGLNEAAHTARCIEAGAEDFLPKPVDHFLLRARVNSLLARRRMWVRELEQFFPHEVARQLIDRPDVLDEGVTTDVTVLYCDIRGYSRISRKLGPGSTVEWVSAVMEELTDCILRNGGVLVDFIGDEVLAMWGAPGDQPDHAALACRTALEMFACLPRLNAAWQESLGEAMEFSIGMNSGPAWVGNSGTCRKLKYGPAGETVNVGSRVQGATKYLKAPLIVTRATHDRLKGRFDSRRLGLVHVVNIAEPVELFEVVPAGTLHWVELKRLHEEALAHFEAGRLPAAAQLLGGMIATHGAAGPPLALLARTIDGLLQPDRWSPVFQLPGK
jgi:adenylate cyclase